MADLATIVAQARVDGALEGISKSALAQFGTPNRRYIGAELLPERNVKANAFREEAIKFRTVIANAGPRYGPAQKKGNALIGSFLVELSNSDIATELTAKDYELLNELLDRNDDMEAMTQFLDLLDMLVIRALVEHDERNRWQAIIAGQVELFGDNGYYELVTYVNPAGHRINASGTWSDDSFDPFIDIFTQVNLLAEKGYVVSRIVTARTVFTIMAQNAKVKQRVGMVTINDSGQITPLQGQASLAQINAALEREGLPPMELYDLKYSTESTTGFFFDRGSMVFFGASGQDVTIDLGDEVRILTDTIGYTAMGFPAGQTTQGRHTYVKGEEDKPPRVEMQGWATSLPVIDQPEGIAVISGIS